MNALQFYIKTRLLSITVVFAFIILNSCTNSQIKNELVLLNSGEHTPRGIEMIYPNDGTIFPPEFPAPGFEWKDSTGHSSEWSIFILDDQANVLISSKSNKNKWKPDSKKWEIIKKRSSSGIYSFTAIGTKKDNSLLPSCKIHFSVSKDSVGADIFYRAVTLPFSYAVKNVHTIEWYIGSIKGGKPRKMLDNLPVCGNCHSFAKDQPLLAMDVDYGNDKGSYVITETIDTCYLKPKNIITWSDYKKEDEEPTFGLLSQISPDGNYVLSTIKDLSVFVAVDDNLAYSQLFFPIKGIIGIYDRKNKSFDALNGANDKKYVQSNPTWSPDGKRIIFARTEAYINEKVRAAGIALLTLDDVNEFSSGEKPFKYDLYTVDFNNGKGGKAIPLEGASNNGKSNYFPKFSPDGKWIVFCQAENFMLLQPDSRLYIMPSNGGEPRLMNCNMEQMNSWHSWSPNSRWLVFSSKNKGLYTQLYLTHIDENGMDSPPVLIENLRFEKRAANIPEFYPFNGDHFKMIKDEFSNTPEYFNRGAFDKMSNNYFKRAMDDLNKAIKIDSNNIESYFNRILLNNIVRQSNSKQDLVDKNKAMRLIIDSLAVNPKNENFIYMKISLLFNMGRENEALKESKHAIKIYPNSYKLREQLSSIYRKAQQYDKAVSCYKNMLKIDPNKKSVLYNYIAMAYMNLNQYMKALQFINQVIQMHPDNSDLLFMRGQILLFMKQYDLAKKDFDAVLSKDSANYKFNELLAQYYLTQGNSRLYNLQKRKTLQILNGHYNKNKEDVEIIFEMASIYMSLKDYRNAENLYNRILSDFPNNYEALKQLAKIKLNKQQWNDVISIYNQLENNYPPEEEFFNNMAIACIQIGNYPKALEYFNKTILLNPNNKDAIFNRNKLKKDMGI